MPGTVCRTFQHLILRLTKPLQLRLICDLVIWKGMRCPEGVAVMSRQEWWGPSSVINRFDSRLVGFVAKTFKDRVFGSTRSRGG